MTFIDFYFYKVQWDYYNKKYLCAYFPLEIKRLAEKEDWIVDNEGLTSLVSSNYFQRFNH